MAQSCLDAAEAVLSDDAHVLLRYKAKYNPNLASGLSGPASSSAGPGAGRKTHTIGSAPPIDDVQTLPFLPEVFFCVKEVFDMAEDNVTEELSLLRKKIIKKLTPLKALTGVMTERAKAISDRKKNRTPAVAGGKKQPTLGTAVKQVASQFNYASVDPKHKSKGKGRNRAPGT